MNNRKTFPPQTFYCTWYLATLTLANEISGSTVYPLNVEVPMKCSNVFPLQENLLVPSGITPLPWVDLHHDDVIEDHVSTVTSHLILLHKLVLEDLQNLHSPH